MENKLGKLIEERGIKKSWLAEQAKVSRNTITRLINGAIPHLDVAHRIAKVLNLTIYDIWPLG